MFVEEEKISVEELKKMIADIEKNEGTPKNGKRPAKASKRQAR